MIAGAPAMFTEPMLRRWLAEMQPSPPVVAVHDEALFADVARATWAAELAAGVTWARYALLLPIVNDAENDPPDVVALPHGRLVS